VIRTTFVPVFLLRGYTLFFDVGSTVYDAVAIIWLVSLLAVILDMSFWQPGKHKEDATDAP
jgi:hypothetical protein